MPPSGVSYSKWDRIETSDDESEPAATQPLEPLLESRKRNADRDSDEALAKRFIGHLQQQGSGTASTTRNGRTLRRSDRQA